MRRTLLKNGTVIDGCNQKPFAGHVLINGGTIESVLTPNHDTPAVDREIDVAGCVIAPGFIDMHSHSDWVMVRPDHPEAMKCLVRQGITTIIGGNCGFSPAPLTALSKEYLAGNEINLLCDRPLPYDWSDMTTFLDRIEQSRPLVNLAQLVGHGTIRIGAAGLTSKPLSADAFAACKNATEKALAAGACGVSFGLGYPPGMFSPLDEIEAFCRVAAETGKPATVHTKALSRVSPSYPPIDPRPHNVRALKEILHIARKTKVKLQISHLVFVGRNTWRTAARCLKLIEEASDEGVDVMFDAFPYTFGNTTVDAVLPAWYLDKRQAGGDNLLARLVARAELRLGFWLVGFSYKDFQLMNPVQAQWQNLAGRRLKAISHLWGKSDFDTVLTLSDATKGAAAMLLHGYSGVPGKEDVLDSVLSHDLCLYQTDALTHFGGFPNAAAIGAFPKILGRYYRDKELISLENAVYRMTGASANRFGLMDRGEIRHGKAADITVFDPSIIDETSAAQMHIPPGLPKGIRHVFINGEHVVDDGIFHDAIRAGKVLRT